MSLLSLSVCIAVAACAVTLIKYLVASRRPRNFPPGPPTLPFIGNTHQLPRTKAYLKFCEFTAEYGSIVGLKLGCQNVVVLNSYEHVKALYDKRGAIYSSRSHTYVANELVCPNEIHLLLLRYGSEWRKQRKIVQTLLNVSAVDRLLPIQNAEATQTIFDILADPGGYYDHVRRYSTAVILASVYGQRGARFDSPNVQALYHAQDQFTAILEQGATPPVDTFPVLKLLPDFLAPWKAAARAVRHEQKSLYLSLLQQTRERLKEGKGTDCYLHTMLRDQEKNDMDDEHLAYLAGNLMEAGSDTTASVLLSFLLAMLKHPQELKLAQMEVDGICGASRSPSVDDIGCLPYIEAIMDETLRWRPVAAGGVPHMLTQDDTYQGHHLPKGTIFFANTWAIHRDDSEYESPDEFMPRRFLNNKFGTRHPVDEDTEDHRRVSYGFGAGRRICPGQRLARNSLILNMAKIAWCFDFSSSSGAVDADIGTAYTDGFLIAPKKFPLVLTPRSEKHREVISQEYRELEPFFAKYLD
ncbi:cytochrome P450 [Xylariaceae sp. FL0804]|nr:cytochrome P450 [Xylariaceae sp. FL0804]